MSFDWSNSKQQLDNIMQSDQHRLLRRLRELEQQHKKNQDIAGKFASWQEQVARSAARVAARAAEVPDPIIFPELPVSEKREEIAELIRNHQVVVLAGETGSGKTTQLPKICLDIGRGVKGMIGHTQPRRIAAHSVASRIAEELQSPLGEKVGYQVRFSDQSTDNTLVKVMTDGILLAEIQNDRYLSRYDTLIIDEAHERSLNIDFLLGYLKQLLPKRPDLKLIITSATIDVQRFSEHFDGAPVIEVSGRTFPVDVWYRPLLARNEDEADQDQYTAIVDAVNEILTHEKGSGKNRGGDILVFLSGEREIREAADALRKAQINHLEVLPFYARLSMAEQQRVFSAHTGRRIVLATNVAETSITVPGIRYVIDPGYARISRYSYRTKVQRLPIEPVSQASANQRKGRCGRVSEGICIRLYSEDDFLSRSEFTDAEILRTNLAAVILQMLQMRMGDIEAFPFLDAPDHRLINDGFKLLEELQAVNPQQRLTPVGQKLAQVTVDPRLARMLLAAGALGCVSEVLLIVSALSVQDPRERPADKQTQADQQHARFRVENSDFLAYVSLWNYLEEQRQQLSQNQLRKLCKKEFISYLRWREWRDIHHQLKLLLKNLDLKENQEPANYESVHKALLTGLLGNLGFNIEAREYLGARNRRFAIFPGSTQAKKTPKWLMAAELIETSKLYAHQVAKIEPEWALDAADHLVKRHYFEPYYDSRSGQVMGYEKVALYGLTLIEKRRISYSHVDPALCRELFIRAALVEGQYGEHPKRKHQKNPLNDFFTHQQQLLKDLDDLEQKSRRRDILVDEQVLFDFYDERIPEKVINLAGFEAWRKTEEQKNPQLLFIERHHLMRHGADDVTEAQFPAELEWRGMVFPLSYHFEPGHKDDGVSIHVPVSVLHEVPEHRLEWLVPGMLREKCIALVKALPKTLRKHFVPVPDVVDKALLAMTVDNISLTEALAHQLKRQKGIDIPLEQWSVDQVDDYYRFNIKVVDDKGKTIASQRNLAELREQYRAQVQQNIQSAATTIERDGIESWDFSTFEPVVTLRRSGINIRAYAALVDKRDSVALQIIDNPLQASVLSRRGIARLIALDLKQPVKYLQKELLKGQELALTVANMGRREEVADELIIASIVYLALSDISRLPLSRHDFEQCVATAQEKLIITAQEVASRLLDALRLLVEVRKQLKQLKNRIELAFTLSDINNQLNQLFYPGTVYDTPFEWLEQYSRYLKGIQARLEKAILNPQKDRLTIAALNNARQRLDDWLEKEGAYELVYNPHLLEYRWALEELRISLFAQTLKTRFPISSKRLDKLWQNVKDYSR